MRPVGLTVPAFCKIYRLRFISEKDFALEVFQVSFLFFIYIYEIANIYIYIYKSSVVKIKHHINIPNISSI